MQTKFAKEVNDDFQKVKDSAAVMSLYGGILGTPIVAGKNNINKLTGMETLYHKTKKDYADSILDQGLLGNHTMKDGSITKYVVENNSRLDPNLNADEFKNKVYIGSRNAALGMIVPGESTILKVKVPYNHLQDGTLNVVDNPELRGLTKEQWIEYMRSLNNKEAPEILENAYVALDKPNTYAIEGDLPPSYLADSKYYTNQNNWLEYVRRNPKRFALEAGRRGIGLALLGGAGLGAKYLYDNADRIAEQN